MKRLVSALLILVMLTGCAWASEYRDTKEDALAMLKAMYAKYQENSNPDDQFLEIASANAVLYIDCLILEVARMTSNSNLIDVYTAWITYLHDIRWDYRQGKVLKKTYAEDLFSQIKGLIDYIN